MLSEQLKERRKQDKKRQKVVSVSEAVQGASVAVIMAAHRANGDKEAIDNERERAEREQ